MAESDLLFDFRIMGLSLSFSLLGGCEEQFGHGFWNRSESDLTLRDRVDASLQRYSWYIQQEEKPHRRPRTHCRDYISHLAWEYLRTSQKKPEDVVREAAAQGLLQGSVLVDDVPALSCA
ncbi:unnamed protein product [Pleuronectes platessa]|uniref:Uncharacterized protein n=1 Tax=Pleuronectes platessa TaxID=8262 RepID=A0A9N7U737_PLEPL|nr:unnamed protein product [Pleuronectes platessa]